jgi:hypothetical protein
MLLKTALEFFMAHGNVCGPMIGLGLEKPTREQLANAVANARRSGQPEAICTEAAATIEEKIGIRDVCQNIGVDNRLALSRKRQHERTYSTRPDRGYTRQ